MEKKTVFKASENEIVKLINDNFENLPSNVYDSIVGVEELSNQKWVVNISPADEFDEEDVRKINKPNDCIFSTQSILRVLCSRGVLEEGEYIIDCTW